MRTMMMWAGLAWMTAGAALAQPPAAHEHRHEHRDAGAPAADGVRHATDAPLRAGMLRIRELLAERPADAAAAAALADGIEAQVQSLFAQCKLEPQADAALHGVLALLLEGAAGLRADVADERAWSKLREALARYPQRFDDPGFAP